MPILVLASGHGEEAKHQVSASDLFWPFVNFSILLILAVWKLRKPLSKSFTNNAEAVQQLFSHAEEKDKSAQAKYDNFKQKMDNLQANSKSILDEAKETVTTFEKDMDKNLAETKLRIEKECKDRLENDKQKLLLEARTEILESVLVTTKELVASNKAHKNKIEDNLLKNMQ